MKRNLLLAVSLGAVLASCAPNYSPQGSKPDSDLSCQDIRDELAKGAQTRNEAQGNKGVSGQNVAYALFFFPGIIFNELNNSDVIRKIDERTVTLNRLYAGKGCVAPNAAPAIAPTTVPTAP
jgi:hypothetical protein